MHLHASLILEVPYSVSPYYNRLSTVCVLKLLLGHTRTTITQKPTYQSAITIKSASRSSALHQPEPTFILSSSHSSTISCVSVLRIAKKIRWTLEFESTPSNLVENIYRIIFATRARARARKPARQLVSRPGTRNLPKTLATMTSLRSLLARQVADFTTPHDTSEIHLERDHDLRTIAVLFCPAIISTQEYTPLSPFSER